MWGIFIMQSKCVVHGRVLSQCMVSSWCRASSQCRSSSECRMSSSCRVSLLCSVSSGAGIFTVQGIFIFRLSSQCMLSIVIHGIFIEQGIFIVQGLTLRERGRDGRADCCWWMRKITDRQQGLIYLSNVMELCCKPSIKVPRRKKELLKQTDSKNTCTGHDKLRW